MTPQIIADQPRSHHHHPKQDLLTELQMGLRLPQPVLPCKYFYDERGSQLFDAICALPEYYPTRTELGIMEQHLGSIAQTLGASPLRIIEYGSGSCTKVRLLLKALGSRVLEYVSLDISGEHLETSLEPLRAEFPQVPIFGVVADYTRKVQLPPLSSEGCERWRKSGSTSYRNLIYFPGSTIGNFHPEPAVSFLMAMREQIRPRPGILPGAILIGVDLLKDPALLFAAYNDAQGITAEFNLNILDHLNREYGSDFRREYYRHHAPFNAEASRIEMHLISKCNQVVRLGGEEFFFRSGQTIRTECSYKYTTESFAALAHQAGLQVAQVWMDAGKLFSVQLLTP
ncbi:MAG: L-histidine N(alpha)-methyltransferase [Candidatus Sumerlaeia bacterium]|nr:L-histidine N(alpha)-methyltransferase [Candidatus Sumerlaeia bacterium]